MIDILLLLGGLTLAVIGLLYAVINSIIEDKRGERIGWVLILIGSACVGIESYVAMELSHQPWVREDPYLTHQIIALQDGNEINGEFRSRRYGMSGYINEELMYVYGYKTYNGGMKIQKANAKVATVFFSDEITPNAKWYKETRSFWWADDDRYTCDIFIPTDSLQAELVIDLQ